MLKKLASITIVIGCAVLSGCGSFFPPVTTPTPTPTYRVFLTESYASSSGIQKLDTQGGPAYYTSGAFTYNALQTQGASAIQAQGGLGSYSAILPSAPSASAPVILLWAVSHDNDITYCPASLNGGLGTYKYTPSIKYIADQGTYPTHCNTAYPNPFVDIDPNNAQYSLPLTMGTPVDTTFGFPVLQYFDIAGNLLGTESSYSVSADGLTIAVPMDKLVTFAPGDVVIAAYSINPDGTLNPLGGAITTILSLNSPGGGGDPGGGCTSMNCMSL